MGQKKGRNPVPADPLFLRVGSTIHRDSYFISRRFFIIALEEYNDRSFQTKGAGPGVQGKRLKRMEVGNRSLHFVVVCKQIFIAVF